ncbi:MAG: TraB/GumN family protein [Desulfobacterales bacterium]
MADNTHMVHRLLDGDKEIILVGTAHVSRDSVRLVEEVIAAESPDTVCVELCASRFQALRQKDRWGDTDIIKVVREKKAFLLLSNLLLAAFQKRIARKMDVTPGAEMLKAVEMAEALGAQIWLADRDIRATLSRAWHALSWWARIKLLYQLLMSMGAADDITEEEIERMKQQDVLEAVLAEVGRSMPGLKTILIDERDRYLAAKIRQAPGTKVVAVVGAGHLPGIRAHWDDAADLAALAAMPPPGKMGAVLKWGIPASIVALFAAGFFFGGKEAGTDMILLWSLCTGVLAGLGAALALAHPATVLSSVVVAPFTTLHPMIAAGWVSGLVEAFSRKPKVRDLESLPQDILSLRGFWRNNVTRILLVVAFTNLGASVGTLVAFPVIVKILLGGA